VRVADKSVVLEAVCLEILAIPFVIAFFLLPWWAAILLGLAVVTALQLLIDAMIPLVAKEPFGSPADLKRDTIHFWLMVPIGLIVTIVLCIAMVKAIARAA
jgi:hypothetical protein